MEDSMHPGRQRALKGKQYKKKGTEFSQAAPANSSSVSVNALKSRIRDVTRVLEYSQNLPLDARIEKERALAGYRQELEKAEHEKERQRMIKRYHMVRFFERQKATRTLKRLRTQLASATPNTPEHDTLADHVHCAEVDLNYTLYHPLLEKYVGIFPRQDAPKTRQDKPAIWTVVEACMANGTLQALRDGKLQTTATAMPLRPQPAAPGTWHRKSGKQNQKASVTGTSANLAANEQDEGSDGGFFEE